MHQIDGKANVHGFTLLEILIALFIFTIVAMIATQALHTIINAQTGTFEHALRLRELQTGLIIMSREIEQAIDRPVTNSIGKVEVAFKGTPSGFTFTHLGFINPSGGLSKSALERKGYYCKDDALWRMVWPAVDQAPKMTARARVLIQNVESARFEYLDGEGRFHQMWPVRAEPNRNLPRAIKVELHIAKWGKLFQIYVIPAEPTKSQIPMPNQQQRELGSKQKQGQPLEEES